MSNLYTAPEADLTIQTEVSESSTPNIFSPNGRIGRIRYLAYNTLGGLVFILLMILIGVVSALSPVIGGVLALLSFGAYMVFTIFWMIKRLHDRNHSGFLWLVVFIPFVNILLYLYLIFAPGEKSANNYGLPAPKNTVALMIAGFGAPIFMIIMTSVLAAIAIPAYEEYMMRAAEAKGLAIEQFENNN